MVTISQSGETADTAALRHLPAAVQTALALEPAIVEWSETFATKEDALFLGRGLGSAKVVA